jgi:hypothetical protein
MQIRSGRLEKRIRLTVPVELCSTQDRSQKERATTENVCSSGARVLMRQAKERNERLMIRTLVGDLWAAARVVYCQRLSNGIFGVGIELEGMRLHWNLDSTTTAAD